LDGGFVYQGRDICLPRTHPDIDLPIHGFGWMSAWEVTSQEPDKLILDYHHKAGDWPWSFTAQLVYSVKDNHFIMALEVTNMSRDAMPLGLGFHPYFPRQSSTQLQFKSSGHWAVYQHGSPTAWHDDDLGFRAGAGLDDKDLDNPFTDWDGVASIHQGDYSISVQCSDAKTAHIYAPSGSDFFCFEPVSHITGELQQNPEACMVRPDDTKSFSVRILPI
jgi:aldose 1-epimerase